MADPQEKPAAAAPAAPKNRLEALEHEIEAWFREHFHDSIVSRSEEMFAHARAGADKLKARLKALV